MLKDILFAYWFFIPAALANMIPIILAATPGLKQWNAPIDCGLKVRGKPLFGPHKTWRGLIGGIVMGLVAFWIQQIAVRHIGWLRDAVGADIYTHGTVLLGACLGFGALAGDALKSFFKRQFGIASGKSWLPFDQIDYIIGATVASLPFVVLTFAQYVWVAVIWFGMHVASTYVGWRLGLKDSPI